MNQGEWWDLWRHDPRATPFQSPAWQEAWWANCGGGERIDAVARDAGGRLIAALPLWVWQDGYTRRLVPVAAGQSDYSDALIDGAAGGAALAGLWAAIAATSAQWDELLLPDLRADSPLLGPVPNGWVASDEPGEICPVLELPREGPLLATLSKSRRRKIVHDHHRAERLGDVETALVGPDGSDEALDALFRLHADRWSREGQAGVLADERIQRFLVAAARGLADAGLLRVVRVCRAGRIVAVLLGFVDGARGHSYINGVDLSIPGQSFGTLAFARLIEDARNGGATAFHFLRGEEAYKYTWGAAPTQTWRRTVRRVNPS